MAQISIDEARGVTMRQATRQRHAEKAVADFNRDHDVGVPVRYWTGPREGEGVKSTTRTVASVLGGHTAVVWVEGHGACIALTHIDPTE